MNLENTTYYVITPLLHCKIHAHLIIHGAYPTKGGEGATQQGLKFFHHRNNAANPPLSTIEPPGKTYAIYTMAAWSNVDDVLRTHRISQSALRFKNEAAK